MVDVERIEIHPAVWKLVLAFVGAVAVALVGMALAVLFEPIPVKVAGILGAAFFGGFGAWRCTGGRARALCFGPGRPVARRSRNRST